MKVLSSLVFEYMYVLLCRKWQGLPVCSECSCRPNLAYIVKKRHGLGGPSEAELCIKGLVYINLWTL